MIPIRHAGAVQSSAAAVSYVDFDGATMDYDSGGGFAQITANRVGAFSAGLKLRTILAGVVLTAITFAAAGAATFGFAMSAPGITSTSGLTVSSGTSALQAITGTTAILSDSVTTSNRFVAATSSTSYSVVGSWGYNSTDGTYIVAKAGSGTDFALYTPLGAVALTLTHATNQVGISNLAVAGAITSTMVTGDIFSNISSTGTSIIKVGQGASNNIQFYWSFNATPASAIGNIATFGYTNPIRIDGSSVSINSQSGGSTSVQALTATTITGTGVIRNEAVSGGFAMGVISSVARITYNSVSGAFNFLTSGNGDAVLSTGHLYAETDAIFDIGASASLLRYRDLFLSRNITIGGDFVGGSVAGGSALLAGRLFSFNGTLNNWLFEVRNSNANPFGLIINLNTGTPPNGTSNQFLQLIDSSATRAEIRSNGGLANFSANNVNLSDARLKTDVRDLESQWSQHLKLRVVRGRFIDQTHDDDNYMGIAQNIGATYPELMDDANPDRLGIYETDLNWITRKVVQECQERIETLERRIAA